VDLLTLTTEVYHIIDRYLPHAFTLFAALLYLVAFCTFLFGFYYIYSVILCRLPAFFILHFYVSCRMLSSISYNMMVGIVFLFLYVILLIVSRDW